MIIWLASYPRSGNTYLRVLFHRLFDLNTYSLHGDSGDIGADQATASIVGHVALPPDWSIDQARVDPALWPVKVHEHPFDAEKTIYVIRDGREAVVSYWEYLRAFTGLDLDPLAVIAGSVMFGSWSEHVRAWHPLTRENTLLLRFEDLAAAPEKSIPLLAQFLNREPRQAAIPSFAELHNVNPKFFRSGRIDSWKGIFEPKHNYLFWLLHREVMIEYGYVADVPDAVQKQVLELDTDLAAAIRAFMKLLELREREKVYVRQLQQQGERLHEYGRRERDYQRQLHQRDEELRALSERRSAQDQQIEQQAEQLARLIAETQALNQQIDTVYHSRIWRMTEPLRKLSMTLKNLADKA